MIEGMFLNEGLLEALGNESRDIHRFRLTCASLKP